MCRCTVVQVFRCTVVQVCRCKVVQVYRCQWPACCCRPNTEHTNLTRTPHTHITVRCSHNCWPMCTCVCAAVEHRSNPDLQPFLFSVCNFMSGVHAAFLPPAVRFTRKRVRSRSFRSHCPTSNCLYPLLDSLYNTRQVRD